MDELNLNTKKGGKGKTVFIIFLILIILGLGGYIVYDKYFVKESPKPAEKTDKTEKTKTNNYDLSQIPTTSEQCKYNYTLNEFNKRENLELCDGELTIFNVENIKLDDIDQNVQVVYTNLGKLLRNKCGLYINGVKIPGTCYQEMSTVSLSIHDNLLFVKEDSGSSVTGTMNVMVFDKLGRQIFDLEDALNLYAIEETITALEKPTYVDVHGLLRGDKLAITDNYIEFKSYYTQGSPCINGYRGSIYRIEYNGNSFSEPKFKENWKFDNDNCAMAYN